MSDYGFSIPYPPLLYQPPSPPSCSKIYFTMQEKVLCLGESSTSASMSLLPGSFVPILYFFGKHFILFGRFSPRVPRPHWAAPSLMYLISQSARWKFDFDCCSRTKDVCTSVPCAIQWTHTQKCVHIRRHRHAPFRPPPPFLGLCPAADAHCHMCNVWRHKWRQIALTLILNPIPNQIWIRVRVITSKASIINAVLLHFHVSGRERS